MNLPSLIPSRFRGVSRPWSNIDEAFDDLIANLKSDVVGNGGRFALDVEEQNDKYIIEAEMPGIDKKNLDVSLQDRLLTIKVNESGEKEKKDRNYVCKERWEGSSSRSVMLPLATSSEAVEANLKDGLLRVTVKKQPESRTKKIAIQ